ncbi:unnamed protein product [Didymodactylos carnosus]|uniref:Cyclin-like domain-containing protein n=1 Tax=Didymodactylos carnosus TaxID=1234261 RepID=A0A813U4W6_9BILA|nr:unnamed protein product [Didymodactylos carnosus]CAF1034510.1 unnamed protein product [Didymodactylos carnosus]CAF3610827.1 unnamed protein product [Didymodactylos carnosus]CAF3802861.1 unnamed protein product [Didymodactylos carnosus]
MFSQGRPRILDHRRQALILKLQQNGDKENKNSSIHLSSAITLSTTITEAMSKSRLEILPSTWTKSHLLWLSMIHKTNNHVYKCQPLFLDQHPALQAKIRSVLLDWLMEVSEVYHLHRETYHLAIDYIDRYLSNVKNVPKHKLQLLGTTALFAAAKIEEIYPPRIADFAYVTDQACSEDDILDFEIDLMKALNWFISPMTAISWLSTYLQLECELYSNQHKYHRFNDEQCHKKRRISISTPLSSSHHLSVQSSAMSTTLFTDEINVLKTYTTSDITHTGYYQSTFLQVARLIDLCTLDVEYSQFPKNIIACSALLTCKHDWPYEKVTSLTEAEISCCMDWMRPFYKVLYDEPILIPSRPSSIPTEEEYTIQIHNISVKLLEDVHVIQQTMPVTTVAYSTRLFAPFQSIGNLFPTPPQSSEKQRLDHTQQQIEIETNSDGDDV